MKRWLWGAWIGFSALAGAQTQTMLWNAESPSGAPNYLSNVAFEAPGTVNSEPAAQLRFNGQWAQFGQTFTSPANLSGFTGFSIVIENLENRDVSFGIRFDRNTAYTDYVASAFTLRPFESRRIYLDVSGFNPGQWGLMCPMPALNTFYIHTYPWQLGLTLNTVYRWQVYLRQPDTVRARVTSMYGQVCNYSVNGLFDRFGQYSRRSWPGKVTSVQDMAAQRADEDAALAANPGNGEELGSSTLTGTATGKWRLTKTIGGKYYFVSPQGRFLWSLGVTSLTSELPTIVTGRPGMFSSLPLAGDPRAAFYGTIVRNGQTKQTFNHFQANLCDKFGESWVADWLLTAARRVKSWGLNTLGAGADGRMRTYSALPFVAALSTSDFDVTLATPSATSCPIPDPFAPGFTSWMTARFTSDMAAIKADSRLIGAYVDGELAWGLRGENLRSRYEIPVAALKAASTQPAKVAFVNRLQTKYGTIAALNTAWRTTFTSWSDLRANPFFISDTQIFNAQPDLSSFALDFGKAYYWRVKTALKAAAPNALYLGSRDHYGLCPDEYFEAQSSYVDVISVDQYSSAANAPWTYFASLRRPVLIAEYSFTGRTGNGFPNLVFPDCDFPDQASRAQAARDFLDRALSTKNIVGAHWFRFVDFPSSGQAQHDQNFTFGLVDITDRPYDEMTAMFRDFSNSMYAQRGR